MHCLLVCLLCAGHSYFDKHDMLHMLTYAAMYIQQLDTVGLLVCVVGSVLGAELQTRWTAFPVSLKAEMQQLWVIRKTATAAGT